MLMLMQKPILTLMLTLMQKLMSMMQT